MKRRIRTAIILLLVIGTFSVMAIRNMNTSRPTLGYENGKLSPLPDSPNCVSSQSEDPSKTLPALPLVDGDARASLDRVEALVLKMGARVIERNDEYLLAEFRTRIMGYTDDVEWLVADGKLHFRSASRVGYWDMGVNRRRLSKLSKQYLEGIQDS